mmetsp:Transcript_17074/g.49303  ORF Transcript_17074/g.49303 Transcript_17074/m.49303 type:complete len:96 (+) Transcript_17074:321-608(+)
MDRKKCDLAHVHLPSALDGTAASKAATMTTEAVAAADGGECKSVPPPEEKGEENNRPRENIAVVAKHLCGAGTDLALKSLVPVRGRISGCVFATC